MDIQHIEALPLAPIGTVRFEKITKILTEALASWLLQLIRRKGINNAIECCWFALVLKSQQRQSSRVGLSSQWAKPKQTTGKAKPVRHCILLCNQIKQASEKVALEETLLVGEFASASSLL